MKKFNIIIFILVLSSFIFADDMRDKNSLRNTGVSAIWILANVSYAGMKAQNIKSRNGTKILALIFGLPGTLLTMFVVKEGSNRAYGVDLPSNPESE
jgi:hypothetical protein